MAVREVLAEADDYIHRVVDGDSLSVCGRRPEGGRFASFRGHRYCPICFDESDDLLDRLDNHPLTPVLAPAWLLCRRLDDAANAVTRPRPLEPSDPQPRRRT